MAALVVVLVSACADEPVTPSRSSPPSVAVEAPLGTAVLVDEVPIAAEEVDRWAGWIADLEPEYVLNAQRRLALTNGLLERAAVAAKFADERERARALIARASDGERDLDGLIVSEIQGSWRDLSLQLWGELQPVRVDEWIGPFERPGVFTLARVQSVDENHGLQSLAVELVQAPFLPTEGSAAAIRDAVDGSKLTIVDDAFGDAIPEAWKYRMRGPQ